VPHLSWVIDEYGADRMKFMRNERGRSSTKCIQPSGFLDSGGTHRVSNIRFSYEGGGKKYPAILERLNN
jgi:hypothetical protein